VVLNQLRNACLREGKRSGHIEVERGFKRLCSDVGDGCGRRAASVVHHDVDLAEFFDRSIGELVEELEFVDIAGKDECTTTETADSSGDFFELVDAARSDGDIGASFSKGKGRCSTDATSGTSDDGDIDFSPGIGRRPLSGRDGPHCLGNGLGKWA
jgi:hypothetical protein